MLFFLKARRAHGATRLVVEVEEKAHGERVEHDVERTVARRDEQRRRRDKLGADTTTARGELSTAMRNRKEMRADRHARWFGVVALVVTGGSLLRGGGIFVCGAVICARRTHARHDETKLIARTR